MLEEILPDLDLALVMSVDPGWGGQEFLPARAREAAARTADAGRPASLGGDRGRWRHQRRRRRRQAVAAGATVVVAGSAIYNDHEPVGAACRHLARVIEEFEQPGLSALVKPSSGRNEAISRQGPRMKYDSSALP